VEPRGWTRPDAQPAAQVEVRQHDAVRGQRVGQLQYALERVHERCQAGDLRADMTVDALDPEVLEFACAAVQCQRIAVGHAEFAVFEPGGDIGVRFGVHVGVHPQTDGRDPAEFARDTVDTFQLRFRFDVEAENFRVQGVTDFARGLAHAGKNDFAGGSPGSEHARELTAGHNVESAAQAREHIQYRQIGVGLDRIANQMRTRCKRGLKTAVRRGERGPGVHVTGCAAGRDDGGKCYVFRIQRAVAVRESTAGAGAHFFSLCAGAVAGGLLSGLGSASGVR